MATIVLPTSAEIVAAHYLLQRNEALVGLEIAKEAIDRLHDVTTGKAGASADEIAYIINEAREIISDCLLMGGYYEEAPSAKEVINGN